MFPYLRLASPSVVKQAPDARAIMKSTQVVVPGAELSTPPMEQIYLEPGVNVKLQRRSKPKTNYSLPSDMPKFPLDFVPVNQTPGALGEEPPIIRVPESKPADLLDVFARISQQQDAESKAVEEAKRMGAMDVGSMIASEYTTAMREKTLEAKIDELIKGGFTEPEALDALQAARMQRAIALAKTPVAVAGKSVQTALAETFAKETQVEAEPGKELITYERRIGPRGPGARRTGAEIAMLRAATAAEEKSKKE